MLLGWASNSSNHFQNSQKKYFLNCIWPILCNIFTENVVSNQAQLFDMIRADTHKWISIHIFLVISHTVPCKTFLIWPINHQPLKKAQWGFIIFQFSTDFIKHFLENSIEGLKIWKKNQSYQKKPPKFQVKSYLALLCVKRWMLLLNLHSFRLSQKSTSSGNYSRVRFWTCLSRGRTGR